MRFRMAHANFRGYPPPILERAHQKFTLAIGILAVTRAHGKVIGERDPKEVPVSITTIGAAKRPP